MKIKKINLKKEKSGPFYTGVKSLFDRKIGSISLLNNDQILGEHSKDIIVRNGKVRD